MKKRARRTKKITIAVLYGGKSSEHDISLMSAKNVVAAIDEKKYRVVLVAIDRDGHWWEGRRRDLQRGAIDVHDGRAHVVVDYEKSVCVLRKGDRTTKISAVFPVLHGRNGEDGSLQGLCQMYGVPCVGPSVLGSAVGMDKDVAKRLLRDADLPIADFLVFTRAEKKTITYGRVARALGVPFFVKPANAGSSVGVHKVAKQGEFAAALADAFRHDEKILVEQYIDGKEVECAVLGSSSALTVSVPGEIVPTHDFYSYDAKYNDDHGATMAIPARIPVSTARAVQTMAAKVMETLCCDGMARVDFFVTIKNEIYVNEINTIPGFTAISMYPKLWEASGLSQKRLMIKLLTLACAQKP